MAKTKEPALMNRLFFVYYNSIQYISRSDAVAEWGPRSHILLSHLAGAFGDGNITFADELDFDPSELDIVYQDDETERQQ